MYAANDLTPWELRNGLWYKMEHYHRNAYGVNGAKYRACRHLLKGARVRGYLGVVSAQSVLSPQSSICATLAEELGMTCTLVFGASKPETVVKHPNVAVAIRAGARVDTTPRVAYNGVIQPYAARLAGVLGAWQLPYAISPPADASPSELRAFLSVNGAQALDLPRGLKTLVIPFGSGNTVAGLLYGLATHGTGDLQTLVLAGVGPDRSKWLEDCLERAGVSGILNKLDIQKISLHPKFAVYSDKMPETIDDIVMHPTYEGKVVRYLNQTRPDWWAARDGSAGFWIVAGPL